MFKSTAEEADSIKTTHAQVPSWMPVRVMPNVTLDEAIEASHAALVPCSDRRVCAIADRRPALKTSLAAFRDEFGTPVLPTVAMFREDAPDGVRTDTAIGGFRDAVCVSAIVAGWSRKSATGTIIHSDAFDVYPWFLGHHDHLGTVTPAMIGIHNVEKLQGQSAPALGRRFLSTTDMDRPLLDALLVRWQWCFVDEDYSDKNLRLFRSLEMARAASKMPGGADANIYDAGRAVALWVSAFEILAHDGKWSSPRSVLSLLNHVPWSTRKLLARDRVAFVDKKKKAPIRTNLAGDVYAHLNSVRNDFLHGNPVTDETLRLQKCQKNALLFAAPLFRLALTAILDLRFSEALPDGADDQERERHAKRNIAFAKHQFLAEDAILAADQPPRSASRGSEKAAFEAPHSGLRRSQQKLRPARS
jgi:hypothetical protein